MNPCVHIYARIYIQIYSNYVCKSLTKDSNKKLKSFFFEFLYKGHQLADKDVYGQTESGPGRPMGRVYSPCL